MTGHRLRQDRHEQEAGEQDPVAAECDLVARMALEFLDRAYQTNNPALIGTAISLWNMAIDRRRVHRD
jgi:hypothetical protein